MRLTSFVLSISISLAVAAPASGLPPLQDDPVVREGFYSIGIADVVRRNCPRISPRLVQTYSFLRELERYATSAGYSAAQFKELEDAMTRKPEFRDSILAELAARGATPGNADAFCAVGRQEIARGTSVGKLLQEN